MRKWLKYTLLAGGGLVGCLAVTYPFGPRVQLAPVEPLPVVSLPTDLPKLEQQLAREEQQVGLKPDNEARIIWTDSLHRHRTHYSLVYVPGFAASWVEGDPVHRQLARRFGYNLYLARPADHGLRSPDAFQNLTPARYAASAERALAIGKAIGDSVILIGTSAGGMLSMYLAERHPEIRAVVLYSPCIAVANPALPLTTGPWGQQILNAVMPSHRVGAVGYSAERARYWLTSYHTNGLLTLQTMIERYMTPQQFGQVHQPLFLGYYYADWLHQDHTVSVSAMQTMFEQIATPPGLKQQVAFPNARHHVIASRLTSGDVPGVYRATERFLREKVNLKPVN